MATNISAEQALVPKIREAVIARIEKTSLREIARQVGMTPSGLDKFINGAEPYRKSRRKLEAWYTQKLARTPADDGVQSPEAAAAAVRILATFHPPARRGAFVDDILRTVNEVLPAEPAWRQEFESYEAYMRAGEI